MIEASFKSNRVGYARKPPRKSFAVDEAPNPKMMKKGRYKYPNFSSGAIKRFLEANRGRDWGAVYSDLCHRYTKRNDRHMLDQTIDWMVKKKVRIESDGSYWVVDLKHSLKGGWHKIFYVDPDTNLLQMVDYGKSKNNMSGYDLKVNKKDKSITFVDKIFYFKPAPPLDETMNYDGDRLRLAQSPFAPPRIVADKAMRQFGTTYCYKTEVAPKANTNSVHLGGVVL